MRLIDCVLRPLFPKDINAEIQLMIQMISYDPEVEATSLTGLAASAAIAVSDIPLMVLFPSTWVYQWKLISTLPEQVENLEVDIIGASMDSVVMVEGEMQEISEEEIAEAINLLMTPSKYRLKLKSGWLHKSFFKKQT